MHTIFKKKKKILHSCHKIKIILFYQSQISKNNKYSCTKSYEMSCKFSKIYQKQYIFSILQHSKLRK